MGLETDLKRSWNGGEKNNGILLKNWENEFMTCKDKIRYQQKSLLFDEKTKINIPKDCLAKMCKFRSLTSAR